MVDRPWHALDAEAALEALGTRFEGLKQDEVPERQERYGPNTIRAERTASRLEILLKQFRSPLIYILLVAFLVTLLLEHWADAVVIAAVLALNATIGFIQEYRAENAMAALANLVSPRARVIRDGKQEAIDSEDLVPGDILVVESGDIVPADVRLLRTTELRVDEAILTGESLPVEKDTDRVPEETAVTDRQNIAHMGTAVVSGRATGLVVATGESTQIGSIATEMRETVTVATPLQARMHRFGNKLSVAILAVSVFVFAVGLWFGMPVADVFLLAVALAVAAIPEGLPVVMTVALAVSVRRMAKRNAIIRQLPAVETLGSCTTIMSDKTGTLTENRMTVQRLWTAGDTYDVTGTGLETTGSIQRAGTDISVASDSPLAETFRATVLANEATLRIESDGIGSQTAGETNAAEGSSEGEFQATDEEPAVLGDPTEVALLVAAAKAGIRREELLEKAPEKDRIPFESDRQFSGSVHLVNGEETLYVKGAPERIIEMCDTVRTKGGSNPLDPDTVRERVASMASDGLRVLAMASGDADVDRTDPTGLTLLGLVGMLDPPRESVPEAIEACHRAGIRVIMVTGDHAGTAAAIAGRIGIDNEEVITGSEVAELDDDELQERLRTTSVYARISPSQKHRIVNLLRARGDIVAVTGDGVNDAPALKAAHLGVAMGITGTDVAKEASSMVLTDDNFATIHAAVQEGRTVFSNISKATHFLLTNSVGVVLAILVTFALAAWGYLPVGPEAALLMLPAQILYFNVVTNGIQDVALAFEPGEEEQYRRPPRDPDAGILSRVLLERTVSAGLLLAVVAVLLFGWELHGGASVAYAQVATLTGLVVFKALQVGACRSETRSIFQKHPLSNRVLFVGTAASLLIHVGALYAPPTQLLLSLQPLTTDTWFRILLVAPSVLVLEEAHKAYRRE